MREWKRDLIVFVICGVAAAVAYADDLEDQLRDQLITHFIKSNLVPILLPRGQDVGDAIDASGAFYAKRTDCFPKLKPPVRSSGNQLEEIVLKSKAEGNFGIGIKRILQVVFGANYAAKSQVKLVFEDVEVASTTTVNLRSTFRANKCPILKAQVGGQYSQGMPKVFVLQEVYYARKALKVSFDSSADAEAQITQVQGIAKQLGLSAELAAGGTNGSQILVVAKEKVPVAARLAFLPRAITYGTLGSTKSNTVEGYSWEDSSKLTRSAQVQVLSDIVPILDNATSGKDNPLREK